MTEDQAVEDFLAHYGIKGMKWGVRKDPAKREAKAQKFDAKAAKTGARIAKVDARLEKAKSKYYRQDLESLKRDLTRQQQRELKDAEAVRSGKLTSGNKKAIAAGAAAGTVAIALILKHQGEVKVNKLRVENKDFVAARDELDRKMRARMADLTGYSKNTKAGGESAAKETEILRNFYENQVNKQMKKFNIDAETIKKMRIQPAF